MTRHEAVPVPTVPDGLTPIERTIRRIREVGRGCGYAVAVHGSMARDLDLIAVPWTEDACLWSCLVEHLELANFLIKETVEKPHGRVGVVVCGGAGCEYVDLSIAPLVEAVAFENSQAPQKPDCEWCGDEGVVTVQPGRDPQVVREEHCPRCDRRDDDA